MKTITQLNNYCTVKLQDLKGWTGFVGSVQAEVNMNVFVFQNAIANASSLAEVERLKGMLQAGQIPGRDLRQGQCGPSAISEPN